MTDGANLKVAVIGLGPIGRSCARAARFDPNLTLVGLVDHDPAKVGQSAAALVDPDGAKPSADEAGPIVTDDLDAVLDTRPDAVVIATSSSFQAIAPLLETLAARGIHAVSSCEEMAWPRYRHALLTQKIDAAAKAGGSVFLGTGVNPGFAMDTLAVTLASMVRRVSKVRCVRRTDAALRREPLQAKIGATLTVEEFTRRGQQKMIGHQGIAESLAMLAAGLGRDIEPGSVVESLEPVVADTERQSALGYIAAGRVCGMRNTATWEDDRLRIELDLTMAVGLDDPKDMVFIEGPVSLCLKIPGALPGDSATIAALMNQLPNLSRVKPGLLTMLDMPPAGCRRY